MGLGKVIPFISVRSAHAPASVVSIMQITIVCTTCLAATTSVGLYCRGSSTRMDPDPGLVGDWLAPAYCDPGQAICGYRQQVEGPQASGVDDTSLNEVEFACCDNM